MTAEATTYKVFAGTMLADIGGGKEPVRVIVAARSERSGARRAGVKLASFRARWTETSNATFDRIALAGPGEESARPVGSTSADDFREVSAQGLSEPAPR